MTITNMATGTSVQYRSLPITSTIDYEGAGVPSSTAFHIEAELHSVDGSLLASDGADITTPVAL